MYRKRRFLTLALRKYCLVLQSSGYAIFFCHDLLVSISFYPVLLDMYSGTWTWIWIRWESVYKDIGFPLDCVLFLSSLRNNLYTPLSAESDTPAPSRTHFELTSPNSLWCLPGYCTLLPTVRTIYPHFYGEISVAPRQKTW